RTLRFTLLCQALALLGRALLLLGKARRLLGRAPGFFLRPLTRFRVLLGGLPFRGFALARLALGGLAGLRLAASRLLGLAALPLGTLLGGASLFLGPALRLERFLLLARLLLEHIALHIGALTTHLHADRARASLAAGKLQLTLRLALQGDARRGRRRRVLAPMRSAQVRQQLELRILADLVLGALDLDSRLVELHEQPLDRHFEDFGKFCDRYFRHYLSSAVLVCCSSNQ